MKAYVLDELGEPGAVRDIPVPEPEEGEVRVKIAAAGLNPFDAYVIRGALKDRMEHRFPFVPGADASGTVDAVGAGVEGFALGDEVFGSTGMRYLGGGTLAEYATMSVATITHKPASVDHATASGIPVAGGTGLILVDALNIEKGNVVVAVGATGGVGSFVVQLAALRGAHVVAVCSAPNAEYARKLGAVDVLDYGTGDPADLIRAAYPDGIDAIADMHGDKESVTRLAELVHEGGHVASAAGGADAEALGARGIEGTNVQGRVTSDLLANLAGLLDEGQIVAPELHPYPLSDSAKALEDVGSLHTRGKIFVLPA
jgi:NADPH:quinone reductase